MVLNQLQQQICHKCGGFAVCYSIRSPYFGKIVFVCFKCATKHIIIKDLF